MAKATKIRPPFAWLGQHTQLTSIVATMGIAAFFRFYELGSLPPGIDGQTATVGLQALNVLNHGTFPGLNAANDYAPLWVWLQSVAIYVFGHTALALRIIPAILGTIAVLTAWLWMKSWFNLRLAWLTAFLLAVTPWAVTLSRSGSEAVLWPLLVTLTLWLATRAWRSRSVVANVLLALVLSVNLLCGPIGWLITATTVLVAITLLWNTKRLFKFDHARLIGIVVLAAGLGLLSYLFGLSLSAIKALPQATGIAMT
ncbi:MAG TPA: glycosyltransferase family 39 protein, partial [Candidatus Saccharimonadia bacterium]|nr:glycosyltransferase family 39 protein [Candidatus Saccharimonadia bacterium]